MRISNITFHNFRIYKGQNTVKFTEDNVKNITIIAGKNGFGKTTFLTALIWGFYGRLMAQVEDKYRKDIKNSGGYEQYLQETFNKNARQEYVQGQTEDKEFFVEITLTNLSIPSIPCRTITIKRSFNLENNEENLSLLIDGDENELTKEVGYEVFINDFILPREIAKFFFFDAEKIVSLAEAKSKMELRNLSKAYSEVLGIKKYEELKKNLESLLSRLRRNGASPEQQQKLEQYKTKEEELSNLITYNQEQQDEIDLKITNLRQKNDELQEKLIREGNSITLEELKALKGDRDQLKNESKEIKAELRRSLDLAPLIISGKHLLHLKNQLELEQKISENSLNKDILDKEINQFAKGLLEKLNTLDLEQQQWKALQEKIKESVQQQQNKESESVEGNILLEFTEERYREFQDLYSTLNSTYLEQFNHIVQKEKNNRILSNTVVRKIKQAEARKGNHLAKKYREAKEENQEQLNRLDEQKNKLVLEFGKLQQQLNSNLKLLSEFEMKFNLAETDKKKFTVTQKLLDKINLIINRIKQDKKFSLQKSLLLGLQRLMHKNQFIHDIQIRIEEDIMDIDLLDFQGQIIGKETLSKGEQQLYATALLKALVDESGIEFPVFIDSPLQKFDKFHAENIIKDFYPSISKQVVLFPLLEKELSEEEYKSIQPNLQQAYLIENHPDGSVLNNIPKNRLFVEFKNNAYVSSY